VKMKINIVFLMKNSAWKGLFSVEKHSFFWQNLYSMCVLTA